MAIFTGTISFILSFMLLAIMVSAVKCIALRIRSGR